MTNADLARLEAAYLDAHNALMCAEPEVLRLVPAEDTLTAIAALERTREWVLAIDEELKS